MNLTDIKANQEAMVTAVIGTDTIANRLMEMGIVPGVSVRVIKAAPFGDPIEVRLLGYNLALRRNEAAMISVAKV
ncbi:ferrous iron transport protein A [Leptolyngbya sp. 7M]|uniref:FeoA family protein n=1 Tax=Leptolyngbya sp. 7M TaxID=2812896 RepID=UPI001CED2E3F|nr:ferrous iron transport protein A [Leptolyngbya sp. 7M]